jgi:hypothetical protein
MKPKDRDGPLTAERLREVVDYDPETGVFCWRVSRGTRKAGSVAGHVKQKGYRTIRVDWRAYEAHRLAWLYVHGEFPATFLDHIDRVKDNNRLANLREATFQQNFGNTGLRADNKTGLKGVHYCTRGKSFVAQITIGRRRKHIGHFKSADDAYAAYCAAARAHFGEFANC